MLQVRRKNLRLRRRGRPSLPDITNHADNFHWLWRVHSPIDQMAYRVLSWERHSSQLLIDNPGKRSVKSIAVIEIASLDDRISQSRHGTRPGDRTNGIRRISA